MIGATTQSHELVLKRLSVTEEVDWCTRFSKQPSDIGIKNRRHLLQTAPCKFLRAQVLDELLFLRIIGVTPAKTTKQQPPKVVKALTPFSA